MFVAPLLAILLLPHPTDQPTDHRTGNIQPKHVSSFCWMGGCLVFSSRGAEAAVPELTTSKFHFTSFRRLGGRDFMDTKLPSQFTCTTGWQGSLFRTFKAFAFNYDRVDHPLGEGERTGWPKRRWRTRLIFTYLASESLKMCFLILVLKQKLLFLLLLLLPRTAPCSAPSVVVCRGWLAG